MDLNKAMVIGRLTRDPEVRSIPSGTQVANFAVATNYRYKDSSGQMQDKPEYHDIVAWGKLAEICAQYLNKGRRVYIEGRIQTRDWTGNDGVRKYKTEIIASDMIMLDGPRGQGGGAAPAAAAAGAPTYESFGSSTPANPPASVSAPQVQDDEIKIEDIPF